MSEAPGEEEVPSAGLFATETMAELSARQGRLADALSIYRHLVRTGEADPTADPERLARWRARIVALEAGGAPAAPARPPERPGPARPQPAPPPRDRPSLVLREPVRSGQLIYAEGRDLIVVASVNPGAQLLADGNIHVYGALRGRAVAGAHGLRDAQVFCLTLDADLVGVDTGYLTNEQLPPALRGGPARVFLTPDGTCAAAPLPVGNPAAGKSSGLAARLRY
jgi:septum formation inhibitor MinC